METYLNGKIVYTKPVNGFFAGPDKYLKILDFRIEESTPIFLEDDSVLLFVRSGHGSITVNGVLFDLRPGAFCWLQSYHVFSIEPEFGGELELVSCVFDYPLIHYMTFVDSSKLATNVLRLRPPLLYCEGALAEQVLTLFEDYREECRIGDVGSTLIRASILGELSDIFVKRSAELLHEEGPISRTRGWDIITYVSMFCARDLRPVEVANLFGLSTERLNLELRKVCGMGFSKVLNRARVNMAASSVLFGELSFSYISARAGFHTDAEFYRAFKEFKGMTPQEYRNMCVGNGWFRKDADETAISILHYLYINSHDAVSLESLSRALFLSEHTIRRVLKEAFGNTFQELLTGFRLRNAEALLVVSELSIQEVSAVAGFNSERTFTRLFKSSHGLSPSEYRKMYRGGGQDE